MVIWIQHLHFLPGMEDYYLEDSIAKADGRESIRFLRRADVFRPQYGRRPDQINPFDALRD